MLYSCLGYVKQIIQTLQAMPIFAQVSDEINSVQEKNCTKINKDLTESRRMRDQEDSSKIFWYLEQHSPFIENEYLYIISGCLHHSQMLTLPKILGTI